MPLYPQMNADVQTILEQKETKVTKSRATPEDGGTIAGRHETVVAAGALVQRRESSSHGLMATAHGQGVTEFSVIGFRFSVFGFRILRYLRYLLFEGS